MGVPALRIHGRFEQEWAQSKPRGMFSVLLLRARQPVPVTELTDWMWPVGKAPDDPVGALGTYRKRIVHALERMDAPPRIRYRDGSYQLDVDRDEIDFHEFGRRADLARAAAREGDHANAVRELASAIDDLWTGTPVPDLHGERAANWRQLVVSESLAPAHSALFTSLGALGEHGQVLRRLADLPVELRQTLTMVKHRLAAQHGAHRFQEAHSYYLDQRRRLRDEGSLDEADELTRFQDELRASQQEHRVVVPVHLPSPRPAEVPNLLPHDVTDFTGRETLIEHLDRITTSATGQPAATIAVLAGDPGVGKTALAVHWAHLAAGRYPGGRLYHDLNGFGEGPVVHESEVVNDFLTAVGVAAESLSSLSARKVRLRGLLSGQRALVVLDNVRDHNQIRHLLDCLSNCTVLITSRSRLPDMARRGASTVPIQPLTYTEGKAWLAKWLGPRASAEAAATSDLVALCGGIALILKIVGERTHSRPGVALAEFADELRDEHTLLGLGGHGPEGSVRAALGWSYHAMSPAEQRLFRLLGTHPGPDVSLDVAAALAAQDRREVQRKLDALVDFHMLSQPESLTRYRLHDLLRRYAKELASASDEKPAAVRRLLDFYLASSKNADRVTTPHRVPVDTVAPAAGVVPVEFADRDSAMRWVARERANINALMGYASANGLHEFVMKMASVVGEIFQRLGHREDAVAGLRIAVQSARLVGDVFEEACAWGNLGFHQLASRDFEAARSSLVTARDMFEHVNDPIGIAVTDLRLGRLALDQGDASRAIDNELSALRTFRRLRSTGEEAITLYRLGEAYRRMGNLTEAARFARDALRLAEQLGDEHTRGCAFAELAAIQLERGEVTDAKRCCEHALRIHEHTDFSQMGDIHLTLASVHVNTANLRDAELCARRALTYCRGSHDIRGQAKAQRLLAELLYKQARHEEAAELWSLALGSFEAIGNQQAVTDIRERLAETPAVPSIPADRTESIQHPSAGYRSV
ncbi:hypothetical protein AOZ06_47200 [Kibdelosporangium phytohabitans]|uniref:Bacterial transcriptional activator domain-containing protein n=1 Tax=Kibdelosporangium phytohabitans TaxID=860235 RepID=A0A0N9IAQ0_9PSEU|nr:hypothetical protein AOZ06_47200 [Kibdelosporangium phytohabitans]